MRSLAATLLLAFASPAFAFVNLHQVPQGVISVAHQRPTLSPTSSTETSARHNLILSTTSDDEDPEDGPTLLEKFVAAFSTTAATQLSRKYSSEFRPTGKIMTQVLTLVRVGIPSLMAGIAGFLLFPAMSLFLCSVWNDAGVFAVLSQDSSQFVQNFLTVAGLLFSILVGQTYYFMYQQQEMVYYSLFNEVTEAKSLLEQVALVCQGRSMYPKVLNCIQQYVTYDLKRLKADPAILLSARPIDDPLETIMYLTSVGVPSTVYETVRSLRQARAQRLGALQRKLPQVHMLLLWILAGILLVSFPLLGAGTQSIGGYNILTVEGCLFGVMTTGIVLTLRVSSIVGDRSFWHTVQELVDHFVFVLFTVGGQRVVATSRWCLQCG